jgi:anti-sigma factor RsiW
VTEADLHAYVDGLLPPARQAEVEAWLLTRPDEAERLAAYRAQNLELHRLFDPVLEEPVPAGIGLPARLHSWWTGRAGRYAAALAFAFAGGLAGWTLRAAADAHDAAPALADALPRQAAIAHVVYSPEVRHPVEVGADQEQHLVAWLSKRLGAPVRPPQLGKLGYELIGGRLLPGESGPVAQFMYHNQGGQRLTLYVSAGQVHNRDTGFRFAQEGPVGVFYWIDGKFGYALSAEVTKNELGTIAMAVHEQLDSAP